MVETNWGKEKVEPRTAVGVGDDIAYKDPCNRIGLDSDTDGVSVCCVSVAFRFRHETAFCSCRLGRIQHPFRGTRPIIGRSGNDRCPPMGERTRGRRWEAHPWAANEARGKSRFLLPSPVRTVRHATGRVRLACLCQLTELPLSFIPKVQIALFPSDRVFFLFPFLFFFFLKEKLQRSDTSVYECDPCLFDPSFGVESGSYRGCVSLKKYWRSKCCSRQISSSIFDRSNLFIWWKN